MNIETVERLTIRPETEVMEAGKECVAALSRHNTRAESDLGRDFEGDYGEERGSTNCTGREYSD